MCVLTNLWRVTFSFYACWLSIYRPFKVKHTPTLPIINFNSAVATGQLQHGSSSGDSDGCGGGDSGRASEQQSATTTTTANAVVAVAAAAAILYCISDQAVTKL